MASPERIQGSTESMKMDDKKDQKKRKKLPEYQYNKANHHPVEEYIITSTERLTSDTPSFVLEVRWPRIAIFYHPASAVCLQLRDRFVAVAREIRRRSIRAPVEFWAVNCEVHRDACEDLEVTSVPTILAFPSGKIDGRVVPRTDENDIQVNKIIQILGIHLQDVEEEEAFVDEINLREKQEDDPDNVTLQEIEAKAREGNDPFRIKISDSDHMKEILHPHSDHSDVYSDAMTSLLHSIDGAVKKDSRGYTVMWSWDEYHAFREWLDLMHWALPTRDMAAVHNILNDLRSNANTIEKNPDEITRILASHGYFQKEPQWSRSCRDTDRSGKGYICGFWKLFHIASVGVVEQHQQVVGDLHRILVHNVVAALRDYVDLFGFADNSDARDLFLGAYDNCMDEAECKTSLGLRKKGPLARFRSRTIPGKTDKIWKEVAIFVWKIHQRYRLQKISSIDEDLPNVEELLWPPSSLCPKCYSAQGLPDVLNGDSPKVDNQLDVDQENHILWNKDPVFDHLKREYWPHTLQTPRVVVLDKWETNKFLRLNKSERTLHNVLVSTGIFLGIIGIWILTKSSKRPRYERLRTKKRLSNGSSSYIKGAANCDHSEWLGDISIQKHCNFSPRRRTKERRSYLQRSANGPFLDD